LRREARHYNEWRTGIWTGFRHTAGSLYLVDPAVKHDHFAVEIGESTKAKIAVLQIDLTSTSSHKDPQPGHPRSILETTCEPARRDTGTKRT
jgi:hypothetical protein